MLPAPFVHATLVALDLPRDLAERYTAPGGARAVRDRERDRHRHPAQPALLRPIPTPAWPFPVH